jgi:alkylresorcinol/alkylpyrone synthase
MMDRKIKVLGTGIALPPFTESTDETLAHVEAWVSGLSGRERERILRVFKNARVHRRYSIMPGDRVFKDIPFHERNALYSEGMRVLGEECLGNALRNAGLEPRDLDYLITTSCTGIMIPSVDAYLVNSLRLRGDIIRLPVTEMGCAGGTSGLIYARHLLRGNPGKKAAVLALESPTSTFQVKDFSMANVVSAAIFGDGAACAILGETEKTAPALEDDSFYHFYDAPDLMGFNLGPGGLEMVLDKEVPEMIAAHFPQIVLPFLERNGLGPGSLNHFIFHPGGKKILQTLEAIMEQWQPDFTETYEVLSRYGNMSSATVLHVLHRFMSKNIGKGETGLMMSFGPGFTAEQIYVQWN